MNSRVQTENRRFPLLRAALLMVLFIMLNACSQDSTPQVDGLRVGPWRAVLQLPGGELPFGMSVSARDGKPVVTLVNGDNRVEVTEITVKDNTVAMLMPGFENRIDGRIEEGVITGTLTMVKAGGKLQKIPLVATHGQAWRFLSRRHPRVVSPWPVVGRSRLVLPTRHLLRSVNSRSEDRGCSAR